MTRKLDFRELDLDLEDLIPNIYLLTSRTYLEAERFLKECYSEDEMGEKIVELNRNFGLMQGRALKKAFEIDEGDLSDLYKLLSVSHWGTLEDVEVVKESETELILQTRDCSWQKYKLREEGEQEDCREIAYAWREEFCKQINPDINVERLMGPPHEKEDIDIWCRWKFTLEKDE